MQLATVAGVARLQELRTENDPPEVVAMLKRRTQERGLAAWERLGRPSAETATPSARYAWLRLAMLEAERAKVLELRRGGEDMALDDVDTNGECGGEGIARPGGVCAHLESARSPEVPGGPLLHELPGGRHDDGAPAHVPGVRQSGVLLFLTRKPRLEAPRSHRTPCYAEYRAGRGLAMVLSGRSAGMTAGVLAASW